MSSIKLYQGDCLELMRIIPDNSVDMVLCDLPYGTTAHPWDCILPLNVLWQHYERIIKDRGVIVLFATEPFTSTLISSNYELYRYSWVWYKNSGNGFLNANYAPLKITEDICVFSPGTVGSLSKNPIIYHPPGRYSVNIPKHNNPYSKYRMQNGYNSMGNKLNSTDGYIQEYSGYPNNVLCFDRDKNTIHPTQKPVALAEYLLETYTSEGDTVLDNCMGSGTTGVACKHLHRNFIGMELDEQYFKAAEERINGALFPIKLF